MIYFHSRAAAGRMLAKRLEAHRDREAVVLALDEGSALVGAQIALNLKSKLLLYKVRNIFLPNEPEPTASMDATGRIKYSDLLSIGQIEEIVSEYRNFIEEERMRKFHEMNVLLGKEGIINKDLLRNRHVIVVADGLSSSFAVSMAADFLKTVKIESLTAAVAIAARDAADQIHKLADEQHILGVIENFISTQHYYDDNTIPNTETAIMIMNKISQDKRITTA